MKTIKNDKGINTIIFAETFEYEAYEQIKKLANFEAYLDSKIRVMPDAHAGKGCTVGTTMTITDKVTPNLVGVDIGCFTKDVKVSLCDNRSLSFEELISEQSKGIRHFGFAKDDNNNIVITELLNVRKTRTANQLVQITLDNGQKYKCTTDHIHYKIDGSECKAIDLKINDSLFPLYIEYAKNVDINLRSYKDKRIKLENYLMIYNPNTKLYDYIHHLSDNFNLLKNFDSIDNGTIRHHSDLNKHNNNPTNIKRKIWKEHFLIHSNNVKLTNKLGLTGFKRGWELHKVEWSKNSSIKMKNLHNNIEFAKNRDIRAGNFFKEYCKTEKFKEDSKLAGIRGKEYLVGYNKSEIGRNKSLEISQINYQCPICEDVVVGGFGIANHRRLKCADSKDVKFPVYKNHKIIEINTIDLIVPEDVYCLSSTEFSNFALDCGVFVHNCGMLTVKLKDKKIDFKFLDEVIKEFIPSGFNVHDSNRTKFDLSKLRCYKKVDLERASLSIGTLGGGNHFIEVDVSPTGEYYLIIHSGSRKLGGDVCKYYQDLAFSNVNEMKKIRENLIKQLKKEKREKDIDSEIKKIKKPATDKALAYLTGDDFDDYMNDMSITQKFATLNRETMAKIILKEAGLTEVERFETIHNYIDFKKRNGGINMILRKGAVSAENGELLLIPINMRDGSLLCIGKGNAEWNYSAPHGAGRLMSRSKAKANIDMTEFKKSMKGIYTTSVVKDTLDEAPQAYKSIDEIKSAITDTVDIVDTLIPVYNYKAHTDHKEMKDREREKYNKKKNRRIIHSIGLDTLM